jgi:hypothetical protein
MLDNLLTGRITTPQQLANWAQPESRVPHVRAVLSR